MNCPYCKSPLDYSGIYEKWSNRDHLPEFNGVCDACGNTFQVFVQTTPDFVIEKLQCAKCQRNGVNPGHAYCRKCEAEIKAYSKGAMK